MSPSVSAHPTETELAAYALGKLDAAASERVRSHLNACGACRTIVEHTPADWFVELLRKRPTPAVSSPHAATPSRQAAVTRGEGPAPAPPADPADLPPALRTHPRYRVLRQLGRGGMGIVYQAEHTVMERLVALKVVSRQLLDSPEAVERFGREVRAAAKLDHPNIVRAYDAEQADDLQLLVMEYVEGKSLSDVLSKKGPLPVAHACQYVRQAALGLQHAHERGMVHRDLKPSNLMLTPKGVVKILDFGLAKLNSERKRGAELTQKDMAMGTPEYMAPEQALDTKNADIRADIYALGCTLYCLLAGRPPFRSDGNDLQVIMAHIDQEPPPVTRFRPDVPPDLARLVARMLAKAPDQRPQTPKEVADALAPMSKSAPGKTAVEQVASNSMAATPSDRAAIPVAAPFAEMNPAARPRRVAQTNARTRPGWLVPVAVLGLLAVGAAVAGMVIKSVTKSGFKVNPTVTVDEVVRLKPAPAAPPDPPAGRSVIASGPKRFALPANAEKPAYGAWEVHGEELVQPATVWGARLLFGEKSWTDYDFTVDGMMTGGNCGFGVMVRNSGVNLHVHSQDGTSRHQDQVIFVVGGFANTSHYLEQVRDSKGQMLSSARLEPNKRLRKGEWHTVRVSVRGDRVRCDLDGDKLFDVFGNPVPAGMTGLMTWDAPCRFRNIKVTDPAGNVLLEGLPDFDRGSSTNTQGSTNPPARPLAPESSRPSAPEPPPAVAAGGVVPTPVSPAKSEPPPAATPAEKLLAGVTQLRSVERELEGLNFTGETPEAQTRKTVKQGAINDLRGAIKALDAGKKGKEVQWFIDRAREKIQRLELIINPNRSASSKSKAASQKRKETVGHAETLLSDAEKTLIEAKVLEPSSK